MNISSIVVQARAEYIEELVDLFKDSDFCDYHLHDASQGKIIVTVEGEGVEEEIAKLVKIQELPHVIAADMMMTYQEELEQERDKLEFTDEVPAMLNDETIHPKDIVYHGDLKKRF
ncbi:chaperone NapD [bacterium]|nr:chaperone NapD [bacterium]MBU1957666.1 chaperone NapD [bacterium]